MTKNMTRKGLALGAAATLIVSGLVGAAPANAAGLYVANYVSLLPNAGTAFSTLSSETFDLKSNVVGSLAGTTDKNLKFLVTDPTEVLAIDVDVDAQASNTPVAAAGVVNAASAKSGTLTTLTVAATHGLVVGDVINVTTAATAGLPIGFYTVTVVPTTTTITIDTGNATAMDITTAPIYFTADLSDFDARGLIAKVGNVGNTNHFVTATVASGTGITDGRKADGSFVVDTQTNANSANRLLRLVNTSSTGATTAVTVTAWVDDNDDNAIDSTEYVSTTQTVTFYANADLTVVSSLSTPVIGDATITGTVSVTPALNGSQITTGTTAVGIHGVATLQSGTATVTTTWNAVNANWDLSIADNNNVEVGSFTFRASAAGTAIGNTASLLVSTATAADTLGNFAATVDQTGLQHDTAGSAGAVTVRAGKSATGVFTVENSSGVSVGAGKSVLVKYTGATTTTDWTVNGTKVLDNAATADVYYTTDANGQLTLAVSSTSGAAADAITIEVRPEGISTTAASKFTLTWAAAVYAIVDLDAPANGAARNLITGGTQTFSLFAGDQWNAPLSGDYRLQMTASGRSDGTTTLGFTGGTATYSVADSALTGSTITVATQLQKLTSGVWGNSVAASDLADVTVTVAAAPSTSIVMPAAVYTADTGSDATADTSFDLWEKQIVAWNAETSQSALVAPYNVVSDDTASIAMGAGTGLAVGDTVTVSGSGLWFAYLDNGVAGTGVVKRLAQNSMTFVLDNAADVIGVYSNTYVKNAVVTVSAQGRSGTTTVTSHVATADSGASVNWTAPVSAASGTTFTVTAQLVDIFGNVVDATSGDVAVSYTGPGFVSGNLPADTNALGVASFAVLLGSSDSGTATVTFSYDTNADGDTSDLGEFVSTRTIAIGAAAVVASDTKVNVGSFKGYVALYAKGYAGKKMSAIVAGKWIVVASLASDFERVVRYTGAGYDIVTTIYIDGVSVQSFNVTTK